MDQNKTIHGLRGFAALLVILAHFYGMAVIGGFFPDRGVTNIGAYGVYLFFIISGFLITQSLLKHKDVGKFLKNRFIRIYPVFLFLHVTLFAVGPVFHYELFDGIGLTRYITDFFSNLFLLPGIFPLDIAQKNAWSLSYEFSFYILASLMYIGLVKTTSKILRYVLLIAAIATSIVVLYVHPKAAYFLVGVLAYYLTTVLKLNYQNRPFFALNGLLLVVVLYLVQDNHILSFLGGTLFFITMIRQEGLFATVLKSKLLQYYGTISYSFYLWHPFTMYPLKVVFSHFKNILPNPYVSLVIFGILGLIMSTAIAHLSHRYIEVWFTKNYLRKKSIAAKLPTNNRPALQLVDQINSK